jgi:hypothetical protein
MLEGAMPRAPTRVHRTKPKYCPCGAPARPHSFLCQRCRATVLAFAPLSDEEAEIFAKLKGWTDLGSSLWAACINSDLPESVLANFVQQVRKGRNSDFKVEIERLLAIPWVHEGPNNTPVYYRSGPSFKDWLHITRWDD